MISPPFHHETLFKKHRKKCLNTVLYNKKDRQ
nr:MAG TPA: hypothetical protein [Caudoviricetes sp.]